MYDQTWGSDDVQNNEEELVLNFIIIFCADAKFKAKNLCKTLQSLVKRWEFAVGFVNFNSTFDSWLF